MRLAPVLILAACTTAPLDPIRPDPDVLLVDSFDGNGELRADGVASVIGGIVITGTAAEPTGDYIWHARIAADGTVAWRRQYDQLFGVSPRCCTTTSATVDGSLVLDDFQNLVAFDGDGFITASAALSQVPSGRAAATPDGGLLVPLGSAIAKISPAGEITNLVGVGGDGFATNVAAAPDGGMLVFGLTISGVAGIARLDAASSFVYQVSGGPAGSAGSAEPTADGGAIVLVDAPEPWLARLEPTGELRWQRTLRYTLALPEAPHAIRAVEQGDGTIIVFGTGNSPWVMLVDAAGTLLGDRRLSRTPSEVVVVDGEAVIFGQFDDHRGVLHRPRDLSAGECSGGLGAAQLELVDAAEVLAPADLGFAAPPAITLAPTNLLSRASDIELSAGCP